ncbi:HAD-IC family P-type ATPase [Leptolyngbya sp. O-77]|uniref:HAD-IC family P-type ATPase n=1 Tax=Leptolyngbya sp. O-77 TaxID=1080068 RepID=UPI00074D2BE9|nr:HAD-IC family P-type ATPase [Leptolyngbya sp. O-77]BAU42481.1 putative copper-exporting P-type ATPase V [Leptolyngbya sp. O-77]
MATPTASPTNPCTIQVVHQLRGRLRLRLAALRWAVDGGAEVRSQLSQYPGVSHVRVNPWAQSVVIEHEPGLGVTEVCDRLRDFLQSFALDQPAPRIADQSLFPAADPLDLELLQRMALPTLGLTLALLITPLEWSLSPWLLGGVTLAAAVPLLDRTRQSLIRGRFDEELLESTWTLFYGFTGDFVAPNLDLVLAQVADVLKEATSASTAVPTTDLIPPIDRVRIQQERQLQEIAIGELKPGDRVFLQAGDTSPADGRILAGEAWLDLSTLTGEPAPLPRSAGERILYGSTLLDGELVIEVEALGTETQYGQELELAEAAPFQQTELSDYAKAVGQTLVLPTLAISVGIYLLTQNLERALAILQLDLITGIHLSTPTAILAMMKRAQRLQIDVRSGRVFETLAAADTVVFARTGTLTESDLSVVEVRIAPGTESLLPNSIADPVHGLLALAAAAEQCDQTEWQHPVACAIVAEANALGLTLPQSEACYPRQGPGLGVSAQIDGQRVVVGSRNYLQQAGVFFPEEFDGPAGSQDGQHHGYWYVYAAQEGRFLGQIVCCAQVRPEAEAAIAGLKQRGMTVYMVTGGAPQLAAAIGAQVGLSPDYIRSELSPQDKKEFVCQLQAAGHTVIYAGEGMDDYPALRYADVAVSTHHSYYPIQDIADLTLPQGRLTALVTAFELADEAIAIVKQNIALITLPNLTATTLGVLLLLDPVLVVAINNTANLLALFNALRPFWTEN